MNSIKNVVSYCRISKINSNNKFYKSASLTSQEDTNAKYLRENGLKLLSTIKHVGSAYNRRQTELLSLMTTMRNQAVIVSDLSRLTRNMDTLTEIEKIGCSRSLSIIDASTGKIYNLTNLCDRLLLEDEIEKTHAESVAISKRMIRSHMHRKSTSTEFGYTRDVDENLVRHEGEQIVLCLIAQLKTEGADIKFIAEDIQYLAKKNADAPFELVEIDDGKDDVDVPYTRMPYPMSSEEIAITLRYYGIKKRTNLWCDEDIDNVGNMHVLMHSVDPLKKEKYHTMNTRQGKETTIDRRHVTSSEKSTSMVREMLMAKKETITESTASRSETTTPPSPSAMTTVSGTNFSVSAPSVKWVSIWYDPRIGLPEGTTLPEGFTIPNTKGTLKFPVIDEE